MMPCALDVTVFCLMPAFRLTPDTRAFECVLPMVGRFNLHPAG